MSLENKSMAELEVLASNLRLQIARNPNHSAMETVELKDVERWIELRRSPGSDDMTF